MSRYTPLHISHTQHQEPTIQVVTPYHPDLPNLFRKAGGRWDYDKRRWLFDERDSSLVDSILIDVFGTNGRDNPPLVDVRLGFPEGYYEVRSGIFLAGRCLARATGRDSGATLGDGVIVAEGDAPTSGGSAKNWTTVIRSGCALEVRDLPRPAVDKLVAEAPDGVDITIVREHVEPSLADLQARRDTLLEELAYLEHQIRFAEHRERMAQEHTDG